MALPPFYLTSFKNVEAIFAAIQSAQAPQRFTQKFLETLGFPNSNDRMFINVLKAIGFLSDTGSPTQRYHEFLDQTQSATVLGRGIRAAYADLYQVNTRAHQMSQNDIKNKMKTLSAGQFTDRVLTQMAGTFVTLCKLADFSGDIAGEALERVIDRDVDRVVDPHPMVHAQHIPSARPMQFSDQPRIGGLVYSINIQLPESRDQGVYDAIFKSLREHLL